MSDASTVSVVVPTYRRPDVLARCLRALHAQTLQPLEILVCRRETDEPTASGIAELSGADRRLVREVVVGPDDHFAIALNAGIMASRGELVALTDDDAEAPPDWLEKIAAPFADPQVAGVGGRDLVPGAEASKPTVGRVSWYGRVVGNHHLGVGPPRDVDVLKGVNCCFRGELARATGIDPRLQGSGTVIHTELSLCLPLRKAGWRLVYDPAITLQHHVAPRGDGDKNHRGGFSAVPYRDTIHNETVAVLDYLPPMGRVAYLAWSAAVGKAFAPGLLQFPRTVMRRGSLTEAVRRLFNHWLGRFRGTVTALTRPRPRVDRSREGDTPVVTAGGLR